MCITYQLSNDLALQVRIQLKLWPTRTACTRIAIFVLLCYSTLCSGKKKKEEKLNLSLFIKRS